MLSILNARFKREYNQCAKFDSTSAWICDQHNLWRIQQQDYNHNHPIFRNRIRHSDHWNRHHIHDSQVRSSHGLEFLLTGVDHHKPSLNHPDASAAWHCLCNHLWRLFGHYYLDSDSLQRHGVGHNLNRHPHYSYNYGMLLARKASA